MKWGLTKRNDDSLVGLDSFRRELSDLFDDFFSITPSSLTENKWLPTMDVEEDEKSIRVKAEIPGIEEKNLRVTLENRILTISGEKEEEKKEDNKRYVVSERRFGSFYRSIALPEEVDTNGIEAKFKNGVLNIAIPKLETAKPQKIKIDIK